MLTKERNKAALGVALGIMALSGSAQAEPDIRWYSGAGAEAGKRVLVITADQASWEQAWVDRLGGPPPIDLEGGMGVLIVPQRPSRYFTLKAVNTGREIVLRCEYHGTGTVGGWAAARIAERRPVRLEDCP